MRLGIISDTHGYIHPEVFEVFGEVDHILHAGDIGPLDILRDLEAVAPARGPIRGSWFPCVAERTGRG